MMCSSAVICVVLMFLNSIQCTHDSTFNVTDDTIQIMKAIEKDESWSGQTIIDILVARSNDQRQEIKKAFKQHYKMDLVNKLENYFYFNTKEAITALMIPNKSFYAYQLHHAIEGFGTDEKAISQILSLMNRIDILNVSAVYENEYGVTLKSDLISDTSGPYMHLLESLCNAERDEDDKVDSIVAIQDAEDLIIACKYVGDIYHADATTFITILTTRSFPQLVLTFREYSKLTNKTIIQTIMTEFSDETQYGFLILVKIAYLSKTQFYAGQLEDSMAGYFNDNRQLIRIIVGRSEIDLNEIKIDYEKIYGMQLINKVDEETSGQYRNLLLAVLRK